MLEKKEQTIVMVVDRLAYAPKAREELSNCTELPLVEILLFVPQRLYNLFESIIGICRWDYPSAIAFLQEELLKGLESAICWYFAEMLGYHQLLNEPKEILDKTSELLAKIAC